jgi:hypothetical protein
VACPAADFQTKNWVIFLYKRGNHAGPNDCATVLLINRAEALRISIILMRFAADPDPDTAALPSDVNLASQNVADPDLNSQHWYL